MTKQNLYDQWVQSRINRTVTIKDAYFDAFDKAMEIVIAIFEQPPVGQRTALERIEEAVRKVGYE